MHIRNISDDFGTMRWDAPGTPTAAKPPPEVHIEEGERAAIPKSSLVKQPGMHQSQEVNFLPLLEKALNNIETKSYHRELINNFMISLGHLEIEHPGATSKIFLEVMRVYKEEMPTEYENLFNSQ